MSTYADKRRESRSKLIAGDHCKERNGTEFTFQVADHRPVAIAQRELLDAIEDSPRTRQLTAINELINPGFAAHQPSHSGSSKVIQPAWHNTEQNTVLNLLRQRLRGAKAVFEKYAIWKYDSYRARRTIRQDGVTVSEEVGDIKGYPDHGRNFIAVLGTLDPREAASTIVHEAKHGKQRIKKGRVKSNKELYKREVEAHLKEEEFRRKNDIRAKRNEFRPPDGLGVKTDEQAIKDYVKLAYRKEKGKTIERTNPDDPDRAAAAEGLEEVWPAGFRRLKDSD